MAGSRLRAFRTYATSANLRASLQEFASTGGGICTSFVPAAQSRLIAIAKDIEGLQPVSLDKVIARFLTLGGEAMLPVADSVQEREALSRACKSLPPESPFYACREFPGLVRRLASTLRELRMWRMSSRSLGDLSRLADPYLSAKLSSLAFLDEGMRAGLRAAARELDSERMERCLSLQIPSGNRNRLWVYTGGEYAPLLADWLNWAARNGVDVWVVVDGHAASSKSFHGADRMVRALKVDATFSGTANGLAEGLFADQPRLDVGLKIRVLSAGDPLAEAEWALRSLKEEVEAGMPWTRTAIYARNADDYTPLLLSAAERFGVPLRQPRRERISQNGWIRLVLDFLCAVCGECPAKLKDLTGSSYLGLPHDVRGHYNALISLSLADPDPWTNLSERLDPGNESDRWLFDAIRLHGKASLESMSFREGYDELAELMEEGWLSRPLEEASPTKIRDFAARSALLHALEQRTALGESIGEEVDLERFVAEMSRLAEHTEYAWPGQEEGVQVASSAYSLGGVEVLCVLGMIEGTFPRRRSEDPVLSDSERASIDALRPGAPLLPNSHDEARAERDELIRLCAAAGKEIIFFYPQVGDDRDNTPAFYLSEVQRVTGASVDRRDIPPARIVPPEPERLFEADVLLGQALEGDKPYPDSPELYSAIAQEKVKGMPEDGVSPRELSDALRCSFQYVFRRRLNLRPVRIESKWHLLRYLPESAGLTEAADETLAREALVQALENELDQLGPEISSAERKLFEAGGKREIRGWVDREFLSRQIWREEEFPWQAGINFGEAETADELPLKGERIKLRGRFAGIGDLQGFAIGQLYGGRSIGTSRNLDKVEDPDFLELGIYIWSLCKRKRNVALEVDTTSGERLLMVLPRPEEFDIQSRVTQGLRVVELGEKPEFYEKVKSLLGVAVERIREGRIEVQPGDHCRYCDYGELCRKAQDYGEASDPFEEENAVVG